MMVSKNIYIPPGLLFQWHITERCNLRCQHCYQENYKEKELQFGDLIVILDRYKDLLKFWRQDIHSRPVRGHITVTGGEPFVRPDFIDLLEVFAQNRKNFSFAILTNGTFIDSEMANLLKKLSPTFVQVSIDGIETTHDQIRGKGSYKKTVMAVKHLVSKGIRTLISFTAHRNNFREFPEVAQLGRQLHVSRVWADLLIPWGSGADIRELVLTTEETKEFFTLMYKVRFRGKLSIFNKTEVAMHRALQFLKVGGIPYHCTAGDTLITIQPNGDLYPCRRMPIKVGNLLKTPLIDLYYNNDLFKRLRNPQTISDGCDSCDFFKSCRGGLKCLSFAVTGNVFKADPGCWKASLNEIGIPNLKNIEQEFQLKQYMDI